MERSAGKGEQASVGWSVHRRLVCVSPTAPDGRRFRESRSRRHRLVNVLDRLLKGARILVKHAVLRAPASVDRVDGEAAEAQRRHLHAQRAQPIDQFVPNLRLAHVRKEEAGRGKTNNTTSKKLKARQEEQACTIHDSMGSFRNTW